MKNDPIEQYKQLRQELIAERDRIRARLAEIEAALEDAPAPQTPAKTSAPRTRRAAKSTRSGNEFSLKDAVIQVLSAKPMKRKEILEAVKKIGYTFTAKNPLNSLGVVLYGKSPRFNNNKGVFSLGRGVKQAAPAKAKTKAKAKAAPKKKRTLSPEARARIVAAQKKRWAKARAAR